MNELTFEITAEFAKQIIWDLNNNPHEWIYEDKSYDGPGVKDFYRYSKDHHLSVYYQSDGKMIITIFSNEDDYGSALEELGCYTATDNEKSLIDAAIAMNFDKMENMFGGPLSASPVKEEPKKVKKPKYKSTPQAPTKAWMRGTFTVCLLFGLPDAMRQYCVYNGIHLNLVKTGGIINREWTFRMEGTNEQIAAAKIWWSKIIADNK
jgi:hypothetical protein